MIILAHFFRFLHLQQYFRRKEEIFMTKRQMKAPIRHDEIKHKLIKLITKWILPEIRYSIFKLYIIWELYLCVVIESEYFFYYAFAYIIINTWPKIVQYDIGLSYILSCIKYNVTQNEKWNICSILHLPLHYYYHYFLEFK